MNQFLTKSNAAIKQKASHPSLSYLRLCIFNFAWALATLFHMANNRIFDDHLHLVLLTLAAILLLYKPGSVFRLVALVSLQLFEVLENMPGGSNHWVFTAFVNMTILSVLLLHIIRKKSFYIDKEQFFESFAPLVRIELIVLYFFVVFHKLNAGFFNVEVSCATDLYLFQNAYSLLPESPLFLSMNAYFTVIIEATIPLFLLFRRTRNLGILVGLLFHTIIAFNPYNGFYDFSSMVFALYLLFTNRAFSLKVYQLIRKFKDQVDSFKTYRPRFNFKKLGEMAGLCMIGFILLWFSTKYFEDFYRHLFWGGYSLFFVSLCLATFTSGKESENKEKLFSIGHKVMLIFPLLVFMNGMSPYFGLKTESSFAMFSNLRTEGDESNHFIIPAGFQLFDFQDELIEVVSSSEPQLQALADNNKLLVYYEFRHMISHLHPEQVDYIRKGELFHFRLSEAGKDHELLTKNPILIRKFFSFRPISKFEPQPCSH